MQNSCDRQRLVCKDIFALWVFGIEEATSCNKFCAWSRSDITACQKYRFAICSIFYFECFTNAFVY